MFFFCLQSLLFRNEASAESFIALIDGLHRLSEDFYEHNISSQVFSPLVQTLSKCKSFGPIWYKKHLTATRSRRVLSRSFNLMCVCWLVREERKRNWKRRRKRNHKSTSCCSSIQLRWTSSSFTTSTATAQWDPQEQFVFVKFCTPFSWLILQLEEYAVEKNDDDKWTTDIHPDKTFATLRHFLYFKNPENPVQLNRLVISFTKCLPGCNSFTTY